MAVKERFFHPDPVRQDDAARESEADGGERSSRWALLTRLHHTVGNAAMERTAAQVKQSPLPPSAAAGRVEQTASTAVGVAGGDTKAGEAG
jgi:hypothetical protein